MPQVSKSTHEENAWLFPTKEAKMSAKQMGWKAGSSCEEIEERRREEVQAYEKEEKKAE